MTPEAASACGIKVCGIKVCGITTEDDARDATRLGAAMLGFNFYPGSPRFVDAVRARVLRDAALDTAQAVGTRPPRMVGVFVNADADAIDATIDAAGLDLVQFHGDEAPALVARYGRRAIKAIRVRDRLDRAQVAPYLVAGDGPLAFLVDADHPGLWGGSGATWQHDSLVDLGRPVIIAGGLGPGNVATAIRAASGGADRCDTDRCDAEIWGVDVCSGIEASKGIKDPDLMTRFFEEAQHVQAAVAS